MAPASTATTTSSVRASVTRKPSTCCFGIPACASAASISRPPPCTTTSDACPASAAIPSATRSRSGACSSSSPPSLRTIRGRRPAVRVRPTPEAAAGFAPLTAVRCARRVRARCSGSGPPGPPRPSRGCRAPPPARGGRVASSTFQPMSQKLRVRDVLDFRQRPAGQPHERRLGIGRCSASFTCASVVPGRSDT